LAAAVDLAAAAASASASARTTASSRSSAAIRVADFASSALDSSVFASVLGHRLRSPRTTHVTRKKTRRDFTCNTPNLCTATLAATREEHKERARTPNLGCSGVLYVREASSAHGHVSGGERQGPVAGQLRERCQSSRRRATSRSAPRPGGEVVVLARRQLEAAVGHSCSADDGGKHNREGGAEKHHARRHHAQQHRVAATVWHEQLVYCVCGPARPPQQGRCPRAIGWLIGVRCVPSGRAEMPIEAAHGAAAAACASATGGLLLP
jgi:hypothetical protein